jgi:hypothetical protein
MDSSCHWIETSVGMKNSKRIEEAHIEGVNITLDISRLSATQQ